MTIDLTISEIESLLNACDMHDICFKDKNLKTAKKNLIIAKQEWDDHIMADVDHDCHLSPEDGCSCQIN